MYVLFPTAPFDPTPFLYPFPSPLSSPRMVFTIKPNFNPRKHDYDVMNIKIWIWTYFTYKRKKETYNRYKNIIWFYNRHVIFYVFIWFIWCSFLWSIFFFVFCLLSTWCFNLCKPRMYAENVKIYCRWKSKLLVHTPLKYMVSSNTLEMLFIFSINYYFFTKKYI